jgi:hypothetical protein
MMKRLTHKKRIQPSLTASIPRPKLTNDHSEYSAGARGKRLTKKKKGIRPRIQK